MMIEKGDKMKSPMSWRIETSRFIWGEVVMMKLYKDKTF